MKGEQYLVFLTEEHEFTEWELNILLKAKELKLSAEALKKIFADRWFDKFLNSSESQIRSNIVQENSHFQLQNSRQRLS